MHLRLRELAPQTTSSFEDEFTQPMPHLIAHFPPDEFEPLSFTELFRDRPGFCVSIGHALR